MEYLIQKVKLIDPRSKFHQKTVDVLIQDQRIIDIKKEIPTSSKIKALHSPNSCISPGWIDLGTSIGEPGNEHRETLESISKSSIKGGYTAICCFPNTQPALHSKSEIEFIINRSKQLPIHIYPIGAISKDCKGNDMAEILQMSRSGAIAFSDGIKSLQNSGLLMRALEYVKMSDHGLIVNIPFDSNLAPAGQINEGKTSTYLGLRGIPILSETVALHRDLEILKYTNSRYLAHKISSSESTQLIKKYKQKHTALYSSVSIFNLIYQDDHMSSFDTNLKLFPPLRSNEDRKGLIKSILDDTIDIICSDHLALEPEKKNIEFQNASFGAINIESAYSLFQTHLAEELGLEQWIKKVAIRPREVFNLEKSILEIGAPADITWFNPTQEWNYDLTHSPSKNTSLLQSKLKGKVLGIFTKSQFYSNDKSN